MMLISNKNNSKTNLFSVVKYSFGLILLIGAFVVFYPQMLKLSTLKNSDIIFCDAELVWKDCFFSNGKEFSNGKTQSDEFAHSGKYSSKLLKGDGWVFGMTYVMDAEPGDRFKISVWRKKVKKGSNDYLVFSSKDGSGFYKREKEIVRSEKNGWGLITMFVRVPDSYLKKEIIIYACSEGKDEVFFDDLKIEKLDSFPESIAKPAFLPRHINIEISEKNYKKLEQIRQEALENGLLITTDDSWVKASMQENGSDEKLPIKIRLKGDWLDHVSSEKWSLRIKVKDPFAWNRLKTFSVQTPRARYYVVEWLLHEFWRKEGVLTTRYDFITLSINGESKGVYAYEEHFEKQLLEYQKRREGPIIRFSEDALWDARQRSMFLKNGQSHARRDASKMPTAVIKPFQEGKTAQSETLSEQYKIAQNLLFQYQHQLQAPSEIFDITTVAKYTAITDILGAYHGLFWHNQRFYYNPVISRLEPIGYDGFGIKSRRDPLVLGKALLENEEHTDNGPLRQLYNDPKFIERYMFYLNKFTEKDYVENFFNEVEGELNERIDFLNTDFPDFKFDKKRILNRINQIRFRIFPYNEHSVRANWFKNKKGEQVIQLSNTHELPLEVVGTGVFPNWLRDTFQNKIHLPGHRIGYKRVIREVKVAADTKYVFYKPYGIDTLFRSTVSLFSLPDGYVPAQKIFAQKELKSNQFYKVIGKEVLFKKGKYVWDKDIIIPKGYRVTFEAGVEADMIRQAKFISKSPVFLNGTNEEPILIYSSDKSGNGFTILQSPETCKLYYTIFKDLNTLSVDGWNLTGAVTFYESDVIIKNCLFKNMHCEDALNTIRCKFTIENSIVDNCFSDGFDADFCTGLIVNSEFKNTGNDCVDFSGSRVEIISSNLTNCGDKGVSAGEESYVILDEVVVDGAVIGAASKDLSYLRVENITLKNCNQGFAAYQKKPEYGPSSIFVMAFTKQNVKYLRTLAPRCTLEYKGHVYVGGE
jgi:CotH kinase protein